MHEGSSMSSPWVRAERKLTAVRLVCPSSSPQVSCRTGVLAIVVAETELGHQDARSFRQRQSAKTPNPARIAGPGESALPHGHSRARILFPARDIPASGCAHASSLLGPPIPWLHVASLRGRERFGVHLVSPPRGFGHHDFVIIVFTTS